MIQVILTKTNEIINDFPTPRAVAYFCEGEPDLWRYNFWDTVKRRRISWAVVDRLCKNINNHN